MFDQAAMLLHKLECYVSAYYADRFVCVVRAYIESVAMKVLKRSKVDPFLTHIL